MSYRIDTYYEPEKVVARYRTAGGRVIEVREGWDCNHEFYDWTCPGCGTEKPRSARDAQQAAQEHAKACTAI